MLLCQCDHQISKNFIKWDEVRSWSRWNKPKPITTLNGKMEQQASIELEVSFQCCFVAGRVRTWESGGRVRTVEREKYRARESRTQLERVAADSQSRKYLVRFQFFLEKRCSFGCFLLRSYPTCARSVPDPYLIFFLEKMGCAWGTHAAPVPQQYPVSVRRPNCHTRASLTTTHFLTPKYISHWPSLTKRTSWS